VRRKRPHSFRPVLPAFGASTGEDGEPPFYAEPFRPPASVRLRCLGCEEPGARHAPFCGAPRT
jgi:hypothetical protein